MGGRTWARCLPSTAIREMDSVYFIPNKKTIVIELDGKIVSRRAVI